jgi:DNA-binding cell septation regulator SpoVG
MIKCIEKKEVQNSALKSVVDIEIDWKGGLILHDVKVFESKGAKFVTLPSKEYVDKATGAKKYFQLVRFKDKATDELFKKAIVKAVDDFVSVQKQAQEQLELPF